jgi:hypothetical protein
LGRKYGKRRNTEEEGRGKKKAKLKENVCTGEKRAGVKIDI